MELGFITMNVAPISRRSALRISCLSVASICLAGPKVAHALKPGKPSKERLLAGTREDKTPEEIEEEKLRVAEEKRIRLEKQRELQAAAQRRKDNFGIGEEKQVEIESNLRGQYYFPTARKRYLPRVKLAWDALPEVEQAASDNRWSEVAEVSQEILLNAVLPMHLYASALGGGGLSIGASFIEKMDKETAVYERSLKKLSKAVKRKEVRVALENLTDMKGAITKYRQLGHLEAADFGIGEISTDLRVGSGFGNNNTALYRRNKSIRKVTENGE